MSINVKVTPTSCEGLSLEFHENDMVISQTCPTCKAVNFHVLTREEWEFIAKVYGKGSH